jgi:hypothetical protein
MPLDAALWALALALFAGATWLTLRRERPWDAGGFFRADLAARRGEPRTDDIPLDLSPSARLAHRLSWRDLGTATADAARARRLADTVVVWFEPAPLALPDLPANVAELAPADESNVDAWAEASVAALAPLLATPHTRVVVAGHARAHDALRLLHAAPGLRDRLRAVLLVHPHLEDAWLRANLTHEAFDVEVLRDVPWLHLRAPGAASLPTPPEPESARTCLVVVDLGEAHDLADPALAAALADTLAALV